jgi:hypothetical protein
MRSIWTAGALSLALAAGAGGRAAADGPPEAGPRAPAAEGKRISLLIGIGDYKNFSATGEPGKTDLRGPMNDLERMGRSLRRFGFGDAATTRTLRDQEATRQGIADAFRWVARTAADSSDAVVIFYSGHGSHAPDADGDEARVSPGDTRDEALVPWDASDIHSPGQLVLDDEIRGWLQAIPTRNVTLIVDGCYSGTITRGAGDDAAGRAKGAIPPPATGSPGAGGLDLDDPRYTLITAASATQTAQELPFAAERGAVFGVLTYHITRVMDGRVLDPARPTLRYDELIADVRSAVRSSMVPQDPQLEGGRGEVLFRVGNGVAARAYATLQGGAGGRQRLDAGAVHGVRRGAIFDVYPAGEMSFRGRPLAQIRVDSVGATESFGAPLAAAAIPAGARATEARVPLGSELLQSLSVFVSPGAQAFRAEVQALDRIQLADSATADVRVARDGVFYRGTLLPDIATRSLCGRLARAFTIAALDRIRNPRPPSPDDLKLDLRVVPAGEDPAAYVSGRAVGTTDTAYVGRRYDIWARVDAPAGSTFYLTAAVAGYSGDAAVLYPAAGTAPAPAELGRWLRIARGVPMTEPHGPEVIKAVANSDPYTLHPLFAQLPACGRGVRGGDRWASDDSPVAGWTTLEKRLLILPAN